MPRVAVAAWLKAVESHEGPEPHLRHLCYVLARTMSDDGATGSYLASRRIGDRMGVHRATVSRYVRELSELGWVELQARRVQYGRKAYTYFPAVPMALHAAPIAPDNGAPESANPRNGAAGGQRNGAARAGIGAGEGRIGAPECARLLQTPTDKSAASPLPANAGSAAPESERDRKLRADVRRYRSLGYSDQRILELIGQWFRPPATADEIEAIR